VTSRYNTRSEYRVPLLGLVDGSFSATDYRNALYFNQMVKRGNSPGE